MRSSSCWSTVIWFLGFLALGAAGLLHGQTTAPSSAPTKAAVPGAAPQKRALEMLQQAYKEDYAKARDPAGRKALARILAQAAEAERDPAIQYVILSQARIHALGGQDADTAIAVVRRILERFDNTMDARLAAVRLDLPDASAALELHLELAQSALATRRFRLCTPTPGTGRNAGAQERRSSIPAARHRSLTASRTVAG